MLARRLKLPSSALRRPLLLSEEHYAGDEEDGRPAGVHGDSSEDVGVRDPPTPGHDGAQCIGRQGDWQGVAQVAHRLGDAFQGPQYACGKKGNAVRKRKFSGNLHVSIQLLRPLRELESH